MDGRMGNVRELGMPVGKKGGKKNDFWVRFKVHRKEEKEGHVWVFMLDLFVRS